MEWRGKMALPAHISQLVEARMENYEYQSDFARRHFARGREEGRAALRRTATTRARAKLEALAPADELVIQGITEEQERTRLIIELGGARDAAQGRAVLEQWLGATSRP